ncbi:MAG: site-specific integrase [Sulfolobaceae archaeon]
MKLELGESPKDGDPYNNFVLALTAAGAGEGTIKLYSTAVKDFLNFIKKDPRLVTSEDLNRWILDLLNREGKIKNLDDARRARNTTIRSYVIAVKRFLKWLGVNVKPTLPKVRRKEPKIVSESYISSLLSACRSLKYRVILSLLIDTGLRSKELLTLKKSDIDIERRMIVVRNTKNGEERVVFFTDRTADLLKKYLPTVKGEKLFDISYQALYKAIKRVGKKVGVELRPHILRHTFATVAIKKGIPLPVVQRLLGHKDIKTTQIYLHLITDDIFKIYKEKFNNI